MTEFERGVRFVLENDETYTEREGPEVTQFGVYTLSMEAPGEKLEKSAAHRKRRVLAILHCAEQQ